MASAVKGTGSKTTNAPDCIQSTPRKLKILSDSKVLACAVNFEGKLIIFWGFSLQSTLLRHSRYFKARYSGTPICYL